jgi:hypothetical protein
MSFVWTSVFHAGVLGAPHTSALISVPSVHEPPKHTGLFCGHTLPHVPQFTLSESVSAQYATPPSGAHSFC